MFFFEKWQNIFCHKVLFLKYGMDNNLVMYFSKNIDGIDVNKSGYDDDFFTSENYI